MRSRRDPERPAEEPRPRAAIGRRSASGVVRIGETSLLAGRTILVVDDHADTRDMMVEYLGHLGARAIAACSVDDAVRVLQAIVVEVVVTEIEMPGEDGYALLSRMDASPSWARVPRVITASRSADERAARAIYLEKPVALECIVSAILRALTL